MVPLKRSRLLITLMLTCLILSPYIVSVSFVNPHFAPVASMELAAPTITGPTFYQFENGSRDEILVYNTFDANPKNYTVTVNGTSYDDGIWSGGELTVYLSFLYSRHMITTLPMQFNFKVTVTNDGGESASIDTTVRVILDVTPPIIETIYDGITYVALYNNVTYEAGSFGHKIEWNITESNPNFYNVTRISNELTSNYTEIESGAWDGENVIVDIDGLNASHWYLYTLFVNDTFGRNATSYVNVTVTPDLSNPAISSPADVTFEFGSKGHEIDWFAYDSNPKNYTIVGTILYNDTTYGNVSAFHSFVNTIESDWSFPNPEGQNIIVSLDGLFLGNYTFTITAFDTFGHSSNDSVNVSIYKDIRAPIIVPSPNLSYEEGYAGDYNITWRTEESNPLSFSLTRDGELLQNGTWRGENFTLFVGGLAVGVHIYNLTLTDFFDATSFAVIQVQVTADANNPTISSIKVVQTLSSQTTNNLTVQAYVWDHNNISSVMIEWGVGDPEDVSFEYKTENMTRTEISGFYSAELGEYTQGQVVWYRILATDNSSVKNEEVTAWTHIDVAVMSYGGGPLPIYIIVFTLGSLSLLVVLVIYFRTRVK
jgi:hypothetical protein